jgi:hypothetical protein
MHATRTGKSSIPSYADVTTLLRHLESVDMPPMGHTVVGCRPFIGVIDQSISKTRWKKCRHFFHSGRGPHLAGTAVIATLGLSARRRIRIMYCVILVNRCLFLCTRNLGQCARCSLTCSRAFKYFGPASGAFGDAEDATCCVKS